jgi:hypothetical protein
MQKRYLHLLLGAATLAAYLGCQSVDGPGDGRAQLAAAAKGKGAHQQFDSVAFTVPDCEGGSLAVSGRTHSVTRVEQDNKGRYHVVAHGNLQGLMAINSAGDTLSGGGALTVTGVFDTLPQTVVDTALLTFISADSSDTLVVAIVVTITIQADGTITAEFGSPTPICAPDNPGGTSRVDAAPAVFGIARAAGIPDEPGLFRPGWAARPARET